MTCCGPAIGIPPPVIQIIFGSVRLVTVNHSAPNDSLPYFSQVDRILFLSVIIRFSLTMDETV